MGAKVFVIAGHGAGDSGAFSDGYSEAELVRRLADRMKARGGDSVQVGDTNVNWYASNYIGKGMCPSGIPVIELHMDSASESARGGHVIIKSGLKPDAYDNALANFIGGFMPGRSNLIVGRSDLANPKRAYAKHINYRLLECGFITNDEDRSKFINRMDELADGILSAFDVASNGSTAPSYDDAPASSGSSSRGGSTGSGFGGTYRCNVRSLNVRSAPSTSSSVVASYSYGETVNLQDWYEIADGYVWGRYVGRSGATRYVAVGKPTGGPSPDDYLIKVGGSSSSSKSVDEIAREVIAGKWGNGQDRKDRLAAAGYDYSEVQHRVNQLL